MNLHFFLDIIYRIQYNTTIKENKAVVVVRTGSAAINRVKAEGYTLKSEYEWYTPVKVGNHYDVYIQTQLPGGGYKDVAGFNVYVDGTVVRAF